MWSFPRSGTTLVNQILTSHSKVESVGEISLIRKFIEESFYENNSISFDKINYELNLNTNKFNDFFFNNINYFLRNKNINI